MKKDLQEYREQFNVIAENFAPSEFECNCGCGREEVDLGFLHRLQRARTIASIPFIILSGVRCPVHNANVGGSDDSSHVPSYNEDERGHAADIVYNSSSECFIILNSLLDVGFTRLGINDGAIHADDDTTKPEEVIWNYYN